MNNNIGMNTNNIINNNINNNINPGLNPFSTNLNTKLSLNTNNNNFNNNNFIRMNNINMNAQNNNNIGYQPNNINNTNNIINDSQMERNNTGFLLYFKVNENKELYLDTDPTTPFSKILSDLINKYEWLRDMRIKCFRYNNSILPFNSNPLQSGLPNETKLDIVFN